MREQVGLGMAVPAVRLEQTADRVELAELVALAVRAVPVDLRGSRAIPTEGSLSMEDRKTVMPRRFRTSCPTQTRWTFRMVKWMVKHPVKRMLRPMHC
jgi:hypothetical protein